ncbi:HEAT repeat domain-containing protein [Cellulomonas dongxiuzhuiae]|uniref:HEAT repeat domain-containing protein n=1 Tax=Cellulomonas dongxiuzhuiae TaxID=2819979 RepID=UPI001FB9C4A2|nr:HEAT repeat domain-containing protein [Cellulomonas dongxiuzhuiae]
MDEKQDYYGERVRPVLDALRAEGVEVSDLENYRVRPQDAARALPVLRRALDEERFLAVAAAAAHAMAVPELVDQVLPDLVRRFRGPLQGYHYAPTYDGPGDANDDMRFSLGSAISQLASPRTAATMLELAQERPLGYARSPVVEELRRTRDPAVRGLLVELLDDPTVAATAIAALRRLGHREALTAIRALHDAPDPEVRRQVRSVLRAWRAPASPSS